MPSSLIHVVFAPQFFLLFAPSPSLSQSDISRVCLCTSVHRHLCRAAFASGSVTFCRLLFAESAFLQAVLKLIMTGSRLPGVLSQQRKKETKATELSKRKKPT